MDSESGSWWSRYGWTTTLLLSAFAIAFLVRTIFTLSVFEQYGWLYVYGGGSDSYYHWRVTEFILTNHRNLIHDPLLKYPLGALNPREPLFDWMNAILGLLLAPIFGGSATNAAAFALNIDSPLWSALTVFPIYLIGKEISSKRMGLVAALLYPWVVGSIQAADLGYANYLTFYTFFILIYFYAYLRTAKAVSSKTYIQSFRHPREVLVGLREMVRQERRAVKWAVFSGVSLGALALAWQGYPLAVAIVIISLAVIMVVERIRRIDSVNLYVVTWIAGLIGFPMAVPYYLGQGLFATWFDLPLLIYFGALIVLLPFVILRQYPWVVTVPVLAGVVGVGFGALAVLAPSSFQTLITGQGYFAKTLIYSTVAEAQAPSFDALVVSYGILTFFLAFVGLALFVLNLARKRFRREHALFVVFAIVTIYLPISAAKFFYVSSPTFALLPAEALLIILDVAGYSTLRRSTESLAGSRGTFTALRRSFKARHVLVLLLITALVVPNIWYSIDAGIPYNTKSGYSTQVFDSLPSFLQTNASNASSFYLGASGIDLDTPNQYDEAGYNWLATQDTNLAYSSRPAFVSWWDYGFQAIAEGQHPSVADNFQNGIPAAGNFLLAQNESLAIGVLATTLLAAEQQATNLPYLPPALNTLLASDGVNLAELHTLLANTSADVTLVVNHPDRYLAVDPSTITPTNAMFDAVSWFLANTLTENGVATVYDDIQSYTGWTIRYAMVDDRLFPFTGTNTGIFYAPAELTGRVIGEDGAPTTYYTIEAEGSDGNVYPLSEVPSGVSIVNYVLNQLAPFYNSMIYRIYMGYNGTDIGLSPGIPGLEGSLTSYTPEPGWMLQHFEVTYRTAYYSPTATTSSTDCDIATNYPQAEALAAKTNGTANLGSDCYFNGGEAILEYYPGQPLSGTITLPNGSPIAGARVTVYDSWGIPHQTVLTSADGSYSVILPPGNDTLNVTSGNLQGLGQNGTELLESIHLYVAPALGFSLTAVPISQNIVLQPGSVDGFVYWNSTGNQTYESSVDPPAVGASVTLSSAGVQNYTATTDSAGSFHLTNVAPGVYNYSVRAAGVTFSAGQVAVPAGGMANATAGLVPSQLKGTVTLPSGSLVSGATVTVWNATGFSESTVTNASGGYVFSNLVPGNFSVRAVSGSTLASNASAAELNSTTNRTLTLGLTLVPVVPISFQVQVSGTPVPGFTVRLTPIRSTVGSASTQSPRPSAALVFTSDATGTVHATVPAGNYSIYGYGPVGSTFVTGFESAYLPSSTTTITVAPLKLSTPVLLTGQSSLPSGILSSEVSATQISLYDKSGNELTFFANSSGSWSVYAPAGNYSVQALATEVSPSVGNFSAVAYLDLVRTTSISLPLTSGFNFATTLGALVPGGTFYPVQAGEVHLTVNPAGATLSTLTASNGGVSFLVPTATSSTTYCLSASATGFGSYQTCSLSAGSLTSLTRIVVPLLNVTLQVSVTGLPSGGTLRLNATAMGVPAQSRSVTGGSSFSVSLAPGPYQITAWAPPTSGTGVLQPPESINVTLPVGISPTNLTVQLYRQVTATGTLSLPSGVSSSDVQVRIYGLPFNFTVTGKTYLSGFRIAPGTYSAYASASVSGVNYTSLAIVTVNATGTTTPTLTLSTGVPVVARLVGPSGGTLVLSVPVYWSGPGGTQLYSLSTNGTVSLTLPGPATYTPSVNVTVAVTVGGVLRYATYAVVAGTTCSVGTSASTCSIPLTVVYHPAGISGQMYWNGGPLTISGTVRLMGPYPSTNTTSVTTTNGAFSLAVLPGVYTLYATAGSGSGVFAALLQVTVPFPSTTVNVTLSPAWTDLLTLVAPSGVSSLATGNVTWTSSTGVSWTSTGVALGTQSAWVLPLGTWTVVGNGTAVIVGQSVPTTASGTVTLLLGNQATSLTLVPSYTRSVVITTLPPTSATVPAGGSATFSFTVTNTGNTPVTIRLYGDPSSWNFTFSPTTVTLGVGPGNSTAGGTVVVRVPYGATTNHAPVALGAMLSASPNTVIGSSSPSPTVNVIPVPGISITPNPSGASVGPMTATVQFSVENTGNTPYQAAVTVADQVQLEQLGWTVSLLQGSSAAASTVSIGPGQTLVFSVVLTTSGYAQPPGTIAVQAQAVNTTGNAIASAEISVPTGVVSAPNGITVSGPHVGTPPVLPDWAWTVIAILPAIAFLAILLTVRWWRTRRWVRR